MEIVMELRNLRKEYFFADRLIRGCMVLTMIGMLWIGSRVHAEGYTEECKREMAVPAAVISYRENMEECGRIAKDAALHVGGAAGSLAEKSEREVGGNELEHRAEVRVVKGSLSHQSRAELGLGWHGTAQRRT